MSSKQAHMRASNLMCSFEICGGTRKGRRDDVKLYFTTTFVMTTTRSIIRISILIDNTAAAGTFVTDDCGQINIDSAATGVTITLGMNDSGCSVIGSEELRPNPRLNPG